MANVVDICNLALANLGDDATISTIDPPEGSVQAGHCAMFYPIARDALLQNPICAWSFATRRVVLAPLVSNSTDWAFAYAVPTDLLRVVKLHPHLPNRKTQLTLAGGVIYTNQDSAELEYIARVDDPAVFPPLFVIALSWQLASMISGPMIKGKEGAEQAQNSAIMSERYLMLAAEADAKSRSVVVEHMPDWLAARR